MRRERNKDGRAEKEMGKIVQVLSSTGGGGGRREPFGMVVFDYFCLDPCS